MDKAKSKIEQLYAKKVKHKKGDSSDDSLLATARRRSRDGATYWKDNWEAAEDDLKFLSGEQWPSQVRTERELEQRPCLVNNVLPTFVDQVLGDQVECIRRFIEQKEICLLSKPLRNEHPLPFASGQLTGPVLQPGTQMRTV